MKGVRVTSVVLGLSLPRLILCAAPGVEAWLPENTAAVLAVPNMSDARARFGDNPWYRLWRDPSMQPFRDHGLERLQVDWLDPFREQAGWDLRDGAACVEGAFAVALLASPDGSLVGSELHWLVLADLGSRSAVVRDFMESRWPRSATNAVPFKDEEGMVLRRVPAPKLRLLPGAEPAHVWAGLTNNWLIAGTRTEDVADALRRLRGEGTTSLAQQADFVRDYQRSLQGGTAYAWVSLRPFIRAVLELADAHDAQAPAEDSIPMPPRRQMLEVSGLTSVTTLAFAVKESPSGTFTELSVGAPAPSRRGLLKMLELSARDASPPPYVGSDVVRFDRLRINFRQTWDAFERLLTDLFPQATSVLDLLFKTAGPEGESGDLREALLGLLGDDLVLCEYAPTSAQPEALAHPPGVTRLSSTNAAQLALSLKALTVLLPPPLTEVRSESWQDHAIYSVPLPRLTLEAGQSPEVRPLAFSALAESVAFSSDLPLLQSLLDGEETVTAPLSALPGLSEASQQVGGMGQGCFRYYNLARAMPWRLTALRRETSLWPSFPRLESAVSGPQAPFDRIHRWFNPRLLPPFEDIAEYFSFSVAAAGSDADRLFYRTFAPHPRAPASPETSPAEGQPPPGP